MASPNTSLNDFAEHLRAVNLTLTVISVALVLAATFGRSQEIDRAVDDIRGITQAVQTWDDTWFKEYVDRRAKEAGYRGQSNELLPTQIKMGESEGVFVDVCDCDWALPKPGPLVQFSFETPKLVPLVDFKLFEAGPDDALKIRRRYTSLGFFRDYWTGLNEAVEARVPSSLPEKALFQSANGGKWEVVNWSSNQKQAPFGGVLDIRDFTCGTPSTIETIKASFAPEDPLHGAQCAYEGSLSEATDDTRRPRPNLREFCRKIQIPQNVGLDLAGYVIVPVSDYKRLPIRPQQNLLEHLASKRVQVNWRFGSFAYAFPELNRLTADYQDLQLDKIQAILRAQKLTSGESIEIVGIKLAVESVRSGGALLILGVQLYFLLHLKEFVRRIVPESEAWDAAWIGLYPGALAVGAFWFSAFLLPTAAVFVLCIPMMDWAGAKWVFALYSSFLIISALLSVTSWLNARRLAQKRPVAGAHASLGFEGE
jgi:hypothetical protein